MRLAASEGYSDYSPLAVYARVYFNGVHVEGVVFADEERGTIVQYVKDSAGKYINDGGHFKTQARYGIVRLEFPERPDLGEQLRKERGRRVE